MNSQKLIGSTLCLAALTAIAIPQNPPPLFTTCFTCNQIYDKPCATDPNVPYVDNQCGSEDWDTPFQCKDFYIRTYTCAAGGTYRTTVIVTRPIWNCVGGSQTADGAICQN